MGELRLFYRLTVLSGLLASVASAQFGSGYLGPSILSRGSSGVGSRGGQQVDLRFFANLNAIYDTGLLPLASDTTGHIVDVGGQAGMEVQVGAYGIHNWRTAQIGLDYRGNYRHYANSSYFDGSDQQLVLGYTYQKSRRLSFDFRQTAGTFSNSFGSVFGATSVSSNLTPPSALLFDNRSTFLESGMSVSYFKSLRNSFTVGGEGYDVMRQSKALIGMHGYTLHGTFEHRLSNESTIAVTYSHYHYDFPRAFGEADIDSFQAGYSTSFDRKRWTFRILAGALRSQVQGLQSVALDPLVADILGISNITETFYRESTLPSGEASLTRQFKNASFSLAYSRGVSPGNGVYLTSRQEQGSANYTYNGVRKTSLSVTGSYGTFASLGQSLSNYRSFGGGASASYAVTRALHIVARYDARRQDIDVSTFKKSSYRMTLGIAFSPGDIPLSIW
jgi:hypothetical protein